MGLKITRTILMHTLQGTIKVTPLGGRKVRVSAPKAVRITDQSGKRLTGGRRKH